MVLQNISNENKIFIDDNITNCQKNSNSIYSIVSSESNKYIPVEFVNEDIYLSYITQIRYDTKVDNLYFWFNSNLIMTKKICENEIVSLYLNDENILILTTMKLPKFLFEDDQYEQYPKFEVNLSDCIYSMKIYLNEYEYIEIPDFQSSYHITDTLKYISDLVFFLKLGNPAFLNHLCNDTKMELSIYDKERKCIGCEIVEFKLGEQGLYLTSTSDEGELESQLVPYHTFFKLVMDKTWEVDFIKE